MSFNKEQWLDRISDINGYFTEAFTEQSDEDLIKLSELVADEKAEAIGKMFIQRTKDYLGEDEQGHRRH